MRVLFLGTGDIAIPSLEWLVQSPDHELVGLVTQPDKPSGRKLTPKPPQIKSKLQEIAPEVPILQPDRIRDHVDSLSALSADIFVVMAYGQILPRSILSIPKVACINLHTSLLPHHRGASPIHASILAGDTTTAVTVMHMAESLDTGDIILAEKVIIRPEETGGVLHDRLADVAPVALEKALALLACGGATRTPQDDSEASYAPKLDRHAGEIDWSESAKLIGRKVRAFDPLPGTSTKLPDGQKLKLFPPVDIAGGDSCPVPGTILLASASGLAVATGDGIIRFHTIQAENRKRLPIADFLNGHPLEAGEVLGK